MAPVLRYFQLLLLWFSFAPYTILADDVAKEVRTWFEAQYAPIWENLDEANPEKIRSFWIEGFRDHPIDADSTIWENSTERWQRNIERYKAEGLSGSTLAAIQVEEISERAVLIRTKWKDYGVDGSIDESYCGTFIAAKFHREWKFTNYFTIECPVD